MFDTNLDFDVLAEDTPTFDATNLDFDEEFLNFLTDDSAFSTSPSTIAEDSAVSIAEDSADDEQCGTKRPFCAIAPAPVVIACTGGTANGMALPLMPKAQMVLPYLGHPVPGVTNTFSVGQEPTPLEKKRQKRAVRLAKNRDAANKSRARRKEEAQQVQQTLKELNQRVMDLNQENAILRTQVTASKGQLWREKELNQQLTTQIEFLQGCLGRVTLTAPPTAASPPSSPCVPCCEPGCLPAPIAATSRSKESALGGVAGGASGVVVMAVVFSFLLLADPSLLAAPSASFPAAGSEWALSREHSTTGRVLMSAPSPAAEIIGGGEVVAVGGAMAFHHGGGQQLGPGVGLSALFAMQPALLQMLLSGSLDILAWSKVLLPALVVLVGVMAVVYLSRQSSKKGKKKYSFRSKVLLPIS